MEYIPYVHSPTTSTRTENPKDVRDALNELGEAQIWENMEAKQMQAKIKEIAARKMQNRPVRGANPKAKRRATHYNLDEATEPTAEVPMEEYGEQDWIDWTAVQAGPTAPDLA